MSAFERALDGTDDIICGDEYRALRAERNRLAAELAALPQSLTDPENQPSQWGTVPAADYNALAAEIARARAVLAHLSPELLRRAAACRGCGGGFDACSDCCYRQGTVADDNALTAAAAAWEGEGGG